MCFCVRVIAYSVYTRALHYTAFHYIQEKIFNESKGTRGVVYRALRTRVDARTFAIQDATK